MLRHMRHAPFAIHRTLMEDQHLISNGKDDEGDFHVLALYERSKSTQEAMRSLTYGDYTRHARSVAEEYWNLARSVVMQLPDSDELTRALRKLRKSRNWCLRCLKTGSCV